MQAKALTQVVLEKNVYQPGEIIRVKINSDNSQVGYDIKGFKLKLKRKIDTEGSLGSEKPLSNHDSTYVSVLKFDGCKAKEKVEVILELPIPADQNPEYIPQTADEDDI